MFQMHYRLKTNYETSRTQSHGNYSCYDNINSKDHNLENHNVYTLLLHIISTQLQRVQHTFHDANNAVIYTYCTDFNYNFRVHIISRLMKLVLKSHIMYYNRITFSL